MKVAYCGINCESCKLYQATINDSDALREEIAGEWGSLYKRSLNISEMNCLGCRSDLVYEACNRCDIKTCNQNKEIEQCSNCGEYSTCDRLKNFLDWQLSNDTGVEIIF